MAVARVERRLAAILAADIVGYSRLVEQDEAGTLAAIKALRAEVIDPLLAGHDGRIVKLMGDGAIVEFGSVVDAVACAVAVQKGVAKRQEGVPAERRIVFRIGVNLGDVVVEGEDLLGDGVNVAARLEQICDAGGVLVSGTAYDHLKGKLDLTAGAARRPAPEEHPRAGAGLSRSLDRRAVRPTPHPRSSAPLGLGRRGLAVHAGVRRRGLVALAGRARRVPRHPIAVLPFDNLGGDEATGRLAEGLTEDIITDLARYRDLAVIARNSTGVYRGTPVDVRTVGTDLNVGYVLEGSIQRQGNHVRVTAQLIDARTGAHAWSGRWDRPTQDVFAVQTEIAERVTSTLGGYGVLTSESVAAAKRKRPADLEAYDLWALAYEALMRGKEEDLDEALVHVDAAITKDPGMARAYIKKAWIRLVRAKFKNDWTDAFADMEQLARTAIRIDPYDAEAHVILAFASTVNGDMAEAKASTTRALELNPGSADILNQAAINMSYLGEPERGAEMCDRSFQLNPSPPYWYDADCFENYFFVGRHADAVDGIDRYHARALVPSSFLLWRAASLAELGRTEEAAAAIEELQQARSDDVAGDVPEHHPFRPRPGAAADPRLGPQGRRACVRR